MLPFVEIFGYKVPMYGASIALGIVLAYNLAGFLGKRTTVGADRATTLYLAGMVGSFGGAKALAWAVEGTATLRGGGVFLGGVIGCILLLVIAARFTRTRVLNTLDLMTPVGAFGHFFGRMGCFLAGCCYGAPTDSALGVRMGKGSVAYDVLSKLRPPLVEAGHTVPLMPTQAMEAGFELLLAAVLAALLIRKPRPGSIFFGYMLCYPVFRFAIETVRFDPERGTVLGGLLSTSQALSLAFFALGVGGMIWTRVAASNRPIPA